MSTKSKRIELNEILQEVLGSTNVYYQPPASIMIKYPCIIYSKETPTTRRADNKGYFYRNKYTVTVISKDPDNTIAETLYNTLEYASFDRPRYVSDNLYHDALTVYY